MNINKDYKFDGWDFDELNECFGLERDEEDEDSGLIVLVEFLYKVWSDSYHHLDDDKCMSESDIKLVCIKIREFLDCLLKESEGHSYHTEVWRAIKNIEDDGEMLRFVVRLVSLMWN